MNPPTATTGTTGGTATAGLSGWRSHRAALLLGAGALLALVAVTLLALDRAPYAVPLDPRNPGPDGAQALARVLEDQGVPVSVVRDQAGLVDRAPGTGDVVVVTNPQDLAPSTLEVLREQSDDATALVLVGSAYTLGALLDLDPVPARSGERTAGCGIDLVEDLRVEVDGGALAGEGCFGDDEAAVLLRRGTTWALSSPTTLSNGEVERADAAALGLRLLGQGERVVWYVPDLADADVTEGFSLLPFLPRWLFPGLGLLTAALLALLVWRARRLGPLVTEPLPVVVRAAESTHSRGRLYRRTGDRQHATAILAAATRRRLTVALALPPGTDPRQLAAEVAARTGRDPVEVLVALVPPPAPTNTALVNLARRLSELENEVRPR